MRELRVAYGMLRVTWLFLAEAAVFATLSALLVDGRRLSSSDGIVEREQPVALKDPFQLRSSTLLESVANVNVKQLCCEYRALVDTCHGVPNHSPVSLIGDEALKGTPDSVLAWVGCHSFTGLDDYPSNPMKHICPWVSATPKQR